ncbi:MAG: type II toxin-antitoxin system RelE family toxin [Actinomycetota bacterium]
MANVEFIDAAIEDLRRLERSVAARVLAKVRLLESNLEAGLPLGSKAGGDLTTFRKLVVGNRDFRIIYRVGPSGLVSVVWVVGARSDDECYKEATSRLKKFGPTPQTIALLSILEQVNVRAARKKTKRKNK